MRCLRVWPVAIIALYVVDSTGARANATLSGFNVTTSGTQVSGTPCDPAPDTWTPLTVLPGVRLRLPILLTDGTVMVQDGETSVQSNWWRLSPDRYGCYADGSWTQLQTMPAGYSPFAFASAVLPDGRVIVEGGEDNFGVKENTNLGAVYDPISDQWTSVSPPNPPPPIFWYNTGDAASVVLPNGTFMLSGWAVSYVYPIALLDASSLTWTVKQPTGEAEGGNEQGWTLLPGGKVLAMDISFKIRILQLCYK